MASIDIDLKEVKKVNYTLSSRKAQISSVRRGIGILRWKIPEDIQKEKDIKNRMADVLKELERLEQEIDDIYSVTNSVVDRYSDTENTLNSKAAMFE